MIHFDYIAVRTLDEACSLLDKHGSGARVLAGGTDLLIELRKQGSRAPKLVVDISSLKELMGISSAGGIITVKSLTTHSEIMRSSLLQRDAGPLPQAASMIGSPQIRNRGTVGGNIMNAATCADTVPALIALGARVTLVSQNGARQIDLADLFVKPYQTKASAGEILTEIQFRAVPKNFKSSFIKLGRRNALAISRLSVAAMIAGGKNGEIEEARIVPGAALPVWRRVSEAEEILTGSKPSTGLFAAAGKKVSDLMISQTGRRWSTEYKEPVIAVLVRRALENCA